MCFDVEMSYTQFIRKQIIILNYSSQLKTRESALTLIAFSTIRFPSTLSIPPWRQPWDAVQHLQQHQTEAALPPETGGQATYGLHTVHPQKPSAFLSRNQDGQGVCGSSFLLWLGKSFLLHCFSVLHKPAVQHTEPALNRKQGC